MTYQVRLETFNGSVKTLSLPSKGAVVGAGTMGEAIIASLLRSGFSADSITILEKRAERVAELTAKYRVNSGSIEGSDVILLATKPQDLETTLEVISNQIKTGSLLVSLLAGIKSERIEFLLPKNVRVVRVMPNTPLLISNGMSVVTGGSSANQSDIAWVQDLMSKSGRVLVMKEKDMDAVTATSGSGPAYFFAVVEAMISAATRLGLDESSAKTLVSQTFLGAAAMLKESGKDAKELRENVTSPNGTTAAALKVFSTNKLDEIIYEAMKAARDRSIELSN